MVKPRGRKRRPAEPIGTGLTLAQMEADADALIGAATGLGDHLRAYRRGRETLAALRDEQRVRARAAACEAALARGVDTDGGHRLIRTGDRRQHRLTSEAVRSAHPALWADARPVAWSLSVTAGGVWVPARLAPIRAATVGQLIASMTGDTITGKRAEAAVTQARAALIAVYQAIESVRPWGGEQLATLDGWAIGYRAVPTFNAVACRALAEARGIDVGPLLSPVTVGGGWRVVPITPDGYGDGLGDAHAD